MSMQNGAERMLHEAGTPCQSQFVDSSWNSWMLLDVVRQRLFSTVTVLVDAPYWVLGTDYDNYAVVWSCSNFGIFSTRKFPLTVLVSETILPILTQNV
jgi:hypothetical protein